MTFIAMISMEDCVILAADREVFLIGSDGSSNSAGAIARKITRTDYGFITASGWADLIEPVKKRFALENPADTEQMISIINEEQKAFCLRAPNLSSEWIQKSTWKLSIQKDGRIVAAFYDSRVDGLSGLGHGLSMFTYPSDVTEDERSAVEEAFRAGSFLQATEDEVNRAVDRVLDAVSFLRRQGRPISREIDFAVHGKYGLVEFSEMADL